MLKKIMLSALLSLILGGGCFTAFALENQRSAICFMGCICVCLDCVPDIQGCAELCHHTLP